MQRGAGGLWQFMKTTGRSYGLEVNVPIPSPAAFAREHGTSFFLLRQANPWLRSDHLTNKGGKTYRIAIP